MVTRIPQYVLDTVKPTMKLTIEKRAELIS